MSSNYGGKSGSSTGGGGKVGGGGSTGGGGKVGGGTGGGGKVGKVGKGGPIRPLYGVVIQQCIQRGDKAEMSALLVEARRQHDELGSAISDLEQASSGSGKGKY
ncbi:MAG: hypothetical protein QOH21_1205 [Acidobacteriota bacterium]|jgi:hypothetical protein|nr:hypothetical protein [Acidobacteriota bacterium]